MIKKFIQQFTDEEFKFTKLRDDYFLADPALVQLKDKIKEDPYSVGLFMGRDAGKWFRPSPALIEMIAKHSDRKVVINRKAEWLFLCGRDIFAKSVIKSNASKGLVLIQNEDDENLGYGLIRSSHKDKKKAAIMNILDKGSYLRIER